MEREVYNPNPYLETLLIIQQNRFRCCPFRTRRHHDRLRHIHLLCLIFAIPTLWFLYRRNRSLLSRTERLRFIASRARAFSHSPSISTVLSFVIGTFSSPSYAETTISTTRSAAIVIAISIATKTLQHASSALSDIFTFTDRFHSFASRISISGRCGAQQGFIRFLVFGAAVRYFTQVRNTLTASYTNLMPVLKPCSAPTVARVASLGCGGSKLLKKGIHSAGG